MMMSEDLPAGRMVDTRHHFKHGWWRILLIIFAVIPSIVTFIFLELANLGSNKIFTHRIANVSDENLTDFRTASWTFVLWFGIFVWQETWLLFVLIGIPRKSNAGYLYTRPAILYYKISIFFIFNMVLNIGWIFLWDRAYFGWSLLIVFLMFSTIIISTIITHSFVQRHRSNYVNSKRIREVWFTGIYVNNVFIVHGTWLYLATLLNLTVWISQSYNRNTQIITNISTIAFSILLAAIIVYFICENIVFFSSMDHIWSPWFVLICVLSGIVFKNYNRTDISDRNKFFALGLLITCCVLFCVRIVLLIVHFRRRKE